MRHLRRWARQVGSLVILPGENCTERGYDERPIVKVQHKALCDTLWVKFVKKIILQPIFKHFVFFCLSWSISSLHWSFSTCIGVKEYNELLSNNGNIDFSLEQISSFHSFPVKRCTKPALFQSEQDVHRGYEADIQYRNYANIRPHSHTGSDQSYLFKGYSDV